MAHKGENTEECRRKKREEEGVQCGARVVKGQMMSLDPFIGNGFGLIISSTSALITLHFPNKLNAWQLSNNPKQFPLHAEIEASWVNTGVNVWLLESAVHSSVFSLAF
jgi:hypothetical protein